MTRALGIVAVLLVAALAGCIENMSDLKDRIQGSSTDDVLPPTNVTDTTKNATKKVGLNPVARIAIYEKGGAKLYEADFTAVDVDFKDAMIMAGKEMSLVGSASEALDRNASLAGHEWSFGDGKTAKGSTVAHTFDAKGGVFPIVLKVTDTKGRSDTQTVRIAVMPAEVVMNETFTGEIQTPVPGLVEAQPVSNTASVPFAIVSMIGGAPVTHVRTVLTLTAASPSTLDLDLAVTNATGGELGSSTAGSTTEEVVLEGLAAEDLTAIVTLATGLQGSYSLAIVTTYAPVNAAVEAFFGGAGHGGHNH